MVIALFKANIEKRENSLEQREVVRMSCNLASTADWW